MFPSPLSKVKPLYRISEKAGLGKRPVRPPKHTSWLGNGSCFSSVLDDCQAGGSACTGLPLISHVEPNGRGGCRSRGIGRDDVQNVRACDVPPART